jgi:hypothetical protein
MTAEAGLMRRRLEGSARRRQAQPRVMLLVAFVATFVAAGVFIAPIAVSEMASRFA